MARLPGPPQITPVSPGQLPFQSPLRSAIGGVGVALDALDRFETARQDQAIRLQNEQASAGLENTVSDYIDGVNERPDQLELVGGFEAHVAGAVDRFASQIDSKAGQELYRVRAESMLNVARSRLSMEELKRQRAFAQALMPQRVESIVRNAVNLGLDHDTVREQLRLSTTSGQRVGLFSSDEAFTIVDSGLRAFSQTLVNNELDAGNYQGILSEIEAGMPGLTLEDEASYRRAALVGLRTVTKTEAIRQVDTNPIATRRMADRSPVLLPEERVLLHTHADRTERALAHAQVAAMIETNPVVARHMAASSPVLGLADRVELAATAVRQQRIQLWKSWEVQLEQMREDDSEVRLEAAQVLAARNPDIMTPELRSELTLSALTADRERAERIRRELEKQQVEDKAELVDRQQAAFAELATSLELLDDSRGRMEFVNEFVAGHPDEFDVTTPKGQQLRAEAIRLALHSDRDRAKRVIDELKSQQKADLALVQREVLRFQEAKQAGDPDAWEILAPLMPESIDALVDAGILDREGGNEVIREIIRVTKVNERDAKVMSAIHGLTTGLIPQGNPNDPIQHDALETIYADWADANRVRPPLLNAGEVPEELTNRWIASQGYLPDATKNEIVGQITSPDPQEATRGAVRMAALNALTPRVNLYNQLGLEPEQVKFAENLALHVGNGMPVSEAVRISQTEAKLVSTDATVRAQRAARAYHWGLSATDPAVAPGEKGAAPAEPHRWLEELRWAIHHYDFEEFGITVPDEVLEFIDDNLISEADFDTSATRGELRRVARETMRAHVMDTGSIRIAAIRAVRDLFGSGLYGLETNINGASDRHPILTRYPTNSLPSITMPRDQRVITPREYVPEALYHGVVKPLLDVTQLPSFPAGPMNEESEGFHRDYQAWIQASEGKSWLLANAEAATFAALDFRDPDVRRFVGDLAEVSFKAGVIPLSLGVSALTHALPLFPDLPPTAIIQGGNGISDGIYKYWSRGVPPAFVVEPHPVQLAGKSPQYMLKYWNSAEQAYSNVLMETQVDPKNGELRPTGVPLAFSLDPTDAPVVQQALHREARTGLMVEAEKHGFFRGDFSRPMEERFADFPKLAAQAKSDPAVRRRLARELGVRMTRSRWLRRLNAQTADEPRAGGPTDSAVLDQIAQRILDSRLFVERAKEELDRYLDTETR